MKLISHWLVCATPLKNAIDRYEKLIEILECSCYFVIVCYMDGIFESLHILWLLDEFRSFVSFAFALISYMLKSTRFFHFCFAFATKIYCWNEIQPLLYMASYTIFMMRVRLIVDSSQMKPRNFTNGSWHHTKVLNLTLLTTTITETKTTTTTTTEMMLLLTLQCVKHLPRNDESQFLAQCSEVNVRHV